MHQKGTRRGASERSDRSQKGLKENFKREKVRRKCAFGGTREINRIQRKTRSRKEKKKL